MPNGLGTEVHWFCPSLDTAGKDTTTLTDLAGTNDATLTNMSASTDWFDAGGLVSIDCDGTDDTCKCGSSDAIGTSDLTLTMWVYDRENANNDWCATRNTGAYGTQAGWSVGHGGDATAGRVRFHVDDGSSNYEDRYWDVGDADKWVHYAFVWDNSAGTLKLYKNGVDQGAGTVAASGGTPAGKSMTGTVVTISGRPNLSSRSLDGQFDDVRIFHEVLGDAEIATLASERGHETTLPTPDHFWCPSLDDDGNGTTTLTDIGGGANSGTLTNMDAGTDWVADTDAGGVRCLELDGTNDYISLTGTAQLPSTDDWTLSIWFKNAESTSETIFSQYIGTAGNGRFLVRRSDSDTSTVAAFLGNYGSHSTVAKEFGTINNSTWNHAVVRRRRERFSFWLNGTKDTDHTDASETRVILQTTGRIGYGNFAGSYWTGKFDDCRIYLSALTDAQCEELYQSGSGRGYLSTPAAGGSAQPTMSAWYVNGGGAEGIFDLDGSSDFYSLTGMTSDPQKVSVAAWVRIDATSTTDMIYAHRSASNDLFQLSVDAGIPKVQIRTSGTAIVTLSGSALTIGAWYHMAGVVDRENDSHALYVDGVAVDTDSTSFSGTMSATKQTVGAYTTNGTTYLGHFDGEIDDLRVYELALNAAEVSEIFNSRGEFSVVSASGTPRKRLQMVF